MISFLRYKTIILVILIALVLIVALVFLIPREEKEVFMSISGALQSPETGVPIPGVDLRVGDTTIRTTNTGQFTFPEVSSKVGIRLTHPELLRAFVLLVDAAESSLFDIELYNALVFTVDREARSRPDVLYERLSPRVQEQLSEEDYQSTFEQFFTEEDLTAQEIVLRDIERMTSYREPVTDLLFSTVVTFEVTKDGDEKEYHFVLEENPEGSSWNLLP